MRGNTSSSQPISYGRERDGPVGGGRVMSRSALGDFNLQIDVPEETQNPQNPVDEHLLFRFHQLGHPNQHCSQSGCERESLLPLNSTNVFAALGTLRKKKKSDKEQGSSKSKSSSKKKQDKESETQHAMVFGNNKDTTHITIWTRSYNINTEGPV
ncbi:hypothetical protein LOK49_LG03G03921 [Camellia lanceoleosa]|uniref:Uncharacterized protein n=1 Tax=Camellia lanceoleosa TaxID=1840588 RepID=A0ACC0I7C9_9ERIC|nr:hypothetical protein LOK49_LG03G03921 [Camellia lanceoleosa]